MSGEERLRWYLVGDTNDTGKEGATKSRDKRLRHHPREYVSVEDEFSPCGRE